MKNYGTIIIGAGVVGASIAYHLTARGYKDILIIDRAAQQGTGSTGAATGGARAQFETDINIRLSNYSIDFFRNWEFDCGYEAVGYLFFATTDEQMNYLLRTSMRQAELGVDVRSIGTDEIRRRVPILNCDDMVGGTFCQTDGYINPMAVMRGFTEASVNAGAELKFDTPAISIAKSGDRVIGVLTANGIIEADNVVIASGAVARELASTAGIDLPVEPLRRQIVWARADEPLPDGLPMVIDIGTGFHFRAARDFRADKEIADSIRRENKEVMFAYPDPDELPSVRTDFDDNFLDKVYKRASHRSQFLFRTVPVREKCRAGLYENTPDHHAILGGCEVEGLYFACGFSGHGVMHSPATGLSLAEIILDGRSSSIDVSSLNISRFRDDELIHESAFI